MALTERQYYPIWEQLKKSGMCEISTHKAYHRRVIRAVIKEKNQDLGFKLECSERTPPVSAKLFYSVNASIVKFTLHIKPLITLDSV